MQLYKILQCQGFGTRKYCQKLIEQGHVAVNGTIIQDAKANFIEKNLCYSVFDEEFLFQEKIYIALNKPKGYECTHQSKHYRNVFDLFPEYLVNRNLQSAGRLDQDTTGLLLLSDDGQFIHALTHPRKHVDKFYTIQTLNEISDAQMLHLQQGVLLHQEKGCFYAKNIEKLAVKQLRFAIDQGVYHQVKRMMVAVGNQVLDLHRDQIANLKLDHLNLVEGEWCFLNTEQCRQALEFSNHKKQ